MKKESYKQLFPLILIIVLLLAGCGSAAAEPPAIPTLASTETAIPEPTLTPTPAIPLALLIVPADMDQEISDVYQTLVYNLAQSAGMRFQVRNTLTMADLEPSLRVVIALPPDPGLMELAAAAPQAQFLSVNIPDMVAGGNLSVLANTNRPDIAAFISGYIAAMITEDYRTGLLIPKDDQLGQITLAAFHNGFDYYCGTCTAFIYPSWCATAPCYPQHVEIPAEEDPVAYNAYSDFLVLQRQVETMYIAPQFATPELLTYLSSSGVLVISDLSPQQKLGNWVATIQPDVIHAIETAWPQLISGAGGVNITSPLILVDVSPEHLPPGKEQQAQDILAQLQAGYILTGVNP